MDLSHEEMEFFAEEALITIIPLFSEGAIKSLDGKLGPFKSQKAINVRLWSALYLKSRRKCQIIIPNFLENEFLNLRLEEEKKSLELVELPSDFFVIFQILFEKFSKKSTRRI